MCERTSTGFNELGAGQTTPPLDRNSQQLALRLEQIAQIYRLWVRSCP